MRIACPSCAVTYEVPDARLKPGRMVRCARCGRQWAPLSEPASAPSPPVPQAPHAIEPPEPDAPPARPALTAMDLLAARSARKADARWLQVAWAASIALLVCLLAGGLIWRHAVMAAWPPSGRLYAVIGFGEREATPPVAPAAHKPPP